MKTNIIYSNNNLTMSITSIEFVDDYILALMSCDEEVDYLTGTTAKYTDEEIRNYYLKCLDDTSRYDFLIFDEGKIIGEVVLNNIDFDVKSANFRICLFNSENFNKGAGFFATKSIINFVFEVLQLQRIGLEVFSFNNRAIRMYEKAGFSHEGRLRNAILDKDGYADILCMSILKGEYFAKYCNEKQLQH